jgi:hypothetical protein
MRAIKAHDKRRLEESSATGRITMINQGIDDDMKESNVTTIPHANESNNVPGMPNNSRTRNHNSHIFAAHRIRFRGQRYMYKITECTIFLGFPLRQYTSVSRSS